MEPTDPNRPQQESLNNQKDEEKEMKAKRKYYGKIFVALIFFVILYEYYIYVYQIMWEKLTSNIYIYSNLYSRHKLSSNLCFADNISPFALHDALESSGDNEHPPR